MERLKVMFVAPVPPPYGGIGNWVLLMDKYLSNRDDIELVTKIDTSPKSRGLDGRSMWDRVVGQGIEMLKLNKKLKQAIKKDMPDVIHLTTSGQLAIIRDILFLKTAKKMGIPAVYHIRFGRIPEIAESNTTEWKLIYKAIQLSTKTIAIDENTYQSLIKYFSADKIIKIPNPFDLKSIPENTANQKEKTVLFLGWCVKTKGVEELLGAWESVKKEFTEWKLCLVGPYEESYKNELINQYDMERVVFEGEKKHDEALELMDKAGIFILPSYTEGFPNAVLEAMALCKPIIATSVGAIPEMLENEAGILIPAENSEAIVNALKQLLPDAELQKRLGSNARNHLVKDYSIDVVVDSYHRVWMEAMENEHI